MEKENHIVSFHWNMYAVEGSLLKNMCFIVLQKRYFQKVSLVTTSHISEASHVYNRFYTLTKIIQHYESFWVGCEKVRFYRRFAVLPFELKRFPKYAQKVCIRIKITHLIFKNVLQLLKSIMNIQISNYLGKISTLKFV